jgi:LysM repeat protein
MQQPRVTRPGPERYVLAMALLVPLAVMAAALAQLQGLTVTTHSTLAYTNAPLDTHRPAASSAAPPPTLAPPTITPVPATPTPAPAPTVQASHTYTVQRGDELKHIAAQYGVSIWSIIDANDIPNPDSLRVGQVLEIPSS